MTVSLNLIAYIPLQLGFLYKYIHVCMRICDSEEYNQRESFTALTTGNLSCSLHYTTDMVLKINIFEKENHFLSGKEHD